MSEPTYKGGDGVRIVARIPRRFDWADSSVAELGKTGTVIYSSPGSDAEPEFRYVVKGPGIVREAWWPEHCLEAVECE